MPRKGENIYKRKDGRWEGRYIRGRDINQKAIYGYLYGKNYTEVKNKLKQAIITKTVETAETIKFAKIVVGWIENKKLRVKESTLSHYKSVIDNHILPILGEYELTSISADIIQNYINELLKEGLTGKTVNDILTIIKNIFKYASCRGFEHNCNLSTISIKNKRNDVETLTTFEQKVLCNYLVDNMNYKNFGILLSIYTGIRLGELCALRWSDIDLSERVLKINKTMLRIQDNFSEHHSNKTKVIITPPKSEDSVRSIPIPQFILSIICKMQIRPDAYILTCRCNSFVEPRNMQYYFKSVLKKCNLRDVNFHILRHTFATRCVENGFEIKSLSEILGHSNVKITLERYVHSSIDLKRKNMDKLNFLSA